MCHPYLWINRTCPNNMWYNRWIYWEVSKQVQIPFCHMHLVKEQILFLSSYSKILKTMGGNTFLHATETCFLSSKLPKLSWKGREHMLHVRTWCKNCNHLCGSLVSWAMAAVIASEGRQFFSIQTKITDIIRLPTFKAITKIFPILFLLGWNSFAQS